MLKTYSLSPSGFKEGKNLRASRKKGLDLATNDVKWHPFHGHVVASGSTSGAVLVWDVARPKGVAAGQEKTAFKHSRTVNRITWHPLQEAWLLTGSQDGTCRLWDARCSPGSSSTGLLFPTGPASAGARAAEAAIAMGASDALVSSLNAFNVPASGLVIPSGADSVRDVAFDPFRPLTFACALEDGSVHIYDVRCAGSAYNLGGSSSGVGGGAFGSMRSERGGPLLRVTAHVGLVVSLAWHPTQPGLFVTGGRDRLIKVWSLPGHSEGANDGYVLRSLSNSASAVGPGNPAVLGPDARSPSLMSAAHSALRGPQPSPLLESRFGGPMSSPGLPFQPHGSLTDATGSGAVRQLVSIQSIASVSRLAWRGGSQSGADNAYFDSSKGVIDGSPESPPTRRGDLSSRSAFGYDEAPAGKRGYGNPYTSDDDECIVPRRDPDDRRRRGDDSLFHLATCAALLDTYVTVWDVRRPFLPVAQFPGHSDVATGIAWVPPPPDAPDSDLPSSANSGFSWLLSAGKDGRLIAHPPSSAVRPHASLRTSCFALSSTHVAWCHQSIDRGSYWRTEATNEPATEMVDSVDSTEVTPSAQRSLIIVPALDGTKASSYATAAAADPLAPNVLRARLERLMAPVFRGVVPAPPPVILAATSALAALPELVSPAFDPPPHAFAALATRYQSEGAPPHVMCAHNARVAEELHLTLLAQTWRVLGTLWTPLPPLAPASQAPKPTVPPATRGGSTDPRARTSNAPRAVVPVESNADDAPAVSTISAGQREVDAAVSPATLSSRGSAMQLSSADSASAHATTTATVADLARAFSASSASGGGASAGFSASLSTGKPASGRDDKANDDELPRIILQLPPTTGPGANPLAPGYVVGLLEALAAVNPDGATSDAFATTDDDDDEGDGSDSDVGMSNSGAGTRAGPVFASKTGASGQPVGLSTPPRPSNAPARAPFPTATKAAAPVSSAIPAVAPAAKATAGPNTASAPAASHPPLTTLLDYEAASWHAMRLAVAMDVIDWHAAECGDVQTAVTVARVLGREVEAMVGVRRLQAWLVAYIDLLHRLRLWAPASTVMARASDEGIRRLNQLNTALASVCASCGKDIVARGWSEGAHGKPHAPADCCVPGDRDGFVAYEPPSARGSHDRDDADGTAASSGGIGSMQAVAPVRCGSCTRAISTCSLCLLPVRGVYLWCQGCGHGGHLPHMTDWFGAQSSLCPTGCGHVCSLEVGGGGP